MVELLRQILHGGKLTGPKRKRWTEQRRNKELRKESKKERGGEKRRKIGKRNKARHF